ncbi:24687_t:CDS:2, partial [Gigaspora rosea]
QLKIHNESNGILSTEDVHKMVKLDCLIKESLRCSTDIAALPHILTDNSFTFKTSNEFQPKRHITSYPNGKTIHLPATKVDKSFITFVGGKRACPGRFFAINEIKIALHKLILRYKIRTESGKVDPARIILTLTYPSNSGLIFENRN